MCTNIKHKVLMSRSLQYGPCLKKKKKHTRLGHISITDPPINTEVVKEKKNKKKTRHHKEQQLTILSLRMSSPCSESCVSTRFLSACKAFSLICLSCSCVVNFSLLGLLGWACSCCWRASFCILSCCSWSETITLHQGQPVTINRHVPSRSASHNKPSRSIKVSQSQ